MANEEFFFTSLTRISDLAQRDFEVQKLARSEWADADYVAATITGAPSPLYKLELANGRIVDAMSGMRTIGALGKRAATLEATGDWQAVGDDLEMNALTGAGLYGKAESIAPWLPRLISLTYDGHVMLDGRKANMADYVHALAPAKYAVPTILLIGTSMSSGKTTTGRIIIHELQRAGLRVAGAKFTGAGRYRDVLSYRDAGARFIIDFVDAGLPSTVVAPARFDAAMQHMLALLSEAEIDVVVAEAGASPLEPYNGDRAVAAIQDQLCCTVLCASDPYAVLGVREAFGIEPDLVAGPTANTVAGIELVRKLTGLEALNLLDDASIPSLVARLRSCLPVGLL